MVQTYQRSGNGYAHMVDGDSRPLGEVVQSLSQEFRSLVELEVALAKSEMSQKVSEAGKDVGYIAAGGFVIYAGFLAIMAAVAIWLAIYIPAWLSALIVGVVVALIGYVLVRKGMGDLKSRNMVPEQTLASLRDDKQAIQESVS
jgi:xanthine/uracil permease